jgi:hypothetical protein
MVMTAYAFFLPRFPVSIPSPDSEQIVFEVRLCVIQTYIITP